MVTPQHQALQLPKSEVRIPLQPVPITPTSQRRVNNEVSYSQNANLAVGDVSTYPHLHSSPLVVVPSPSAEAWHSDFVTYEEPSEGSRKRKRSSGIQVVVNISQTRDQREASQQAIRLLQDIIQDIFEADDQSQSDAVGALTSTDTQYFILAHHEGREVITLAPSVHIRLESALQKVISVGRLGEIPVEHLQRLQKLCEAALSSAESSDLRIESGWNADDFTGWISRLETMDLGLRSARTIVRIMTGGREEKQLYSEELLQSVLGVVKKILDQCIIPIVEARNSGPDSAIFEAACSHKKVVSQLLFDTNKVMTLLAKLLPRIEMAEMIITGIEFFTTPLLFVENSHSEKESVLGIQKFEGLRRTAMDMIAIIFSRYPEQRIFLFDEILSSLQKLPVSRQHARQFKVGEGKSIQLVSALILRLVQTSATPPETLKSYGQKKEPHFYNGKQESDSEIDVKQVSEPKRDTKDSEESEVSSDDDQPRHSTAMQLLSKEASALMDNAAKSAQYVVLYLVPRAMTSSKTGDQPHRQLLDIFIEDLIAVLSLPDWPAAELLLRLFLASCRNIAENPKSLAPAKNMALELLGQMGSAISELVSTTRLAAKSLENDNSEFNGYLQEMLDDYADGSLENSEVVIWGGPFHAVLEYLQPDDADAQQAGSADGYYLARWAKVFSSGDIRPSGESELTASKLRKMLSGTDWFIAEYVSPMLFPDIA